MTCRTNNADYIHAKWCNDHGTIIYPVPVNATSKGTYFIVVEKNGKPSQGKVIFKDEPAHNETSVWDQIRKLYRMIYEKNNKTVT